MPTDRETIAAWIRAAFDGISHKYAFDETNVIFQFSYRLPNKLSTTRFFILTRETDYLIHAVSPIGGDASDTKMTTELALLAVKINSNLVQGRFDVDLRNGEIRFRLGVECTDLDELSNAFVIKTIATAVKMWMIFGECFLGVIFNGLDSDEALKLKKE